MAMDMDRESQDEFDAMSQHARKHVESAVCGFVEFLDQFSDPAHRLELPQDANRRSLCEAAFIAGTIWQSKRDHDRKVESN